MADETLAQQLAALSTLLTEVDARLARAPVAPEGLEDMKQSVDDLRTNMWAILSAGHGVVAPSRVERLKLRRAVQALRAIQSLLAGGRARRHPEHTELEFVARELADAIAALPRDPPSEPLAPAR